MLYTTHLHVYLFLYPSIYFEIQEFPRRLPTPITIKYTHTYVYIYSICTQKGTYTHISSVLCIFNLLSLLSLLPSSFPPYLLRLLHWIPFVPLLFMNSSSHSGPETYLEFCPAHLFPSHLAVASTSLQAPFSEDALLSNLLARLLLTVKLFSFC